MLQNICDLVDSYYIVDKAEKLNSTYLASSTQIYSDGDFNQHVGSDGNVHISNVINANYIMFLDQNKNIYIAIYRYIYDSKFKEIIDNLINLRKITGSPKHAKKLEESSNMQEDTNTDSEKNIVNLNEFVCEKCNSDVVWNKPYKDSDTIIAFCKLCGMEYAFIPSKYYVLKAKKKIYKPNNSFVNIKL